MTDNMQRWWEFARLRIIVFMIASRPQPARGWGLRGAAHAGARRTITNKHISGGVGKGEKFEENPWGLMGSFQSQVRLAQPFLIPS